MKLFISCIFLVVGLVGCATVPVTMNLPQQNSGLSLSTEKDKYPFEVAILLPDSFSSYNLKSSLKNVNMTYEFQYDIGNDFTETLPIFFENRFYKATAITSLNNSDKFDFVFIPTISKSRINTWITTTVTQEPAYAIEINLGVVTNKNGKELSSTSIKEVIEKTTEIACWTCLGENILNQQKIKNEYMLVLSNIYSKLDEYLAEVIK
jgi:hypothetical protein